MSNQSAFYMGRKEFVQYVKKLASLFLVLIGVSLLSFILANISSVDPAEAIARRTYSNPTQEQIAEIRHDKGLDRPVLTQYVSWLGNSLKGDLGTSYQTGKPVAREISGKLVATISLVGVSLLWIAVFTIPLGILSAIRKNGIGDHLIRGVTVLGISIPSFWFGFILLTAFAISIPVFKVVEYGNLRSIILPSVTLSVPVICSSVRMLRATLLEKLKKDYVIYAQARGLSNGQIMWKHVLKNALPPMVTLFFQNIGMMVGGSAIVESVFSWPGLGSYFVASITNRDLPVITGCVLVLGIIFVVCNTIGEIVNRVLNPRMVSGKEVAYIG